MEQTWEKHSFSAIAHKMKQKGLGISSFHATCQRFHLHWAQRPLETASLSSLSDVSCCRSIRMTQIISICSQPEWREDHLSWLFSKSEVLQASVFAFNPFIHPVTWKHGTLSTVANRCDANMMPPPTDFTVGMIKLFSSWQSGHVMKRLDALFATSSARAFTWSFAFVLGLVCAFQIINSRNWWKGMITALSGIWQLCPRMSQTCTNPQFPSWYLGWVPHDVA